VCERPAKSRQTSRGRWKEDAGSVQIPGELLEGKSEARGLETHVSVRGGMPGIKWTRRMESANIRINAYEKNGRNR